MIKQVDDQHNMMSFGLKNVAVTYQRMTNKVFKEEIDETLDMQMNDMIVKTSEEGLHDQHLARVFRRVCRYNMRLN